MREKEARKRGKKSSYISLYCSNGLFGGLNLAEGVIFGWKL